MSFSANLPGLSHGLAGRFRASVDELLGVVPLSVASVSIRPHEGGPLEVLATHAFGEAPTGPAPLAIGQDALQWLEVNGRELVLAVGPAHAGSEFYRPFLEHGLRSAIVFPVFQAGSLVGTVTVGSGRTDAYTGRHLQLLKMMVRDLTPHFPKPAPATVATPVQVRPSAVRARPGAGRQEPRTQPAAQHPDEALIEADSLGRIAKWDESAEDLFGWSGREVVGSFLTFFYREEQRRLIDPSPIEELVAGGVFRTRALCYDSEGLPVTCEVELRGLKTPGGATGFRGRFRRVQPETLLPREKLQFGFAKLYTFTNPVERQA